MLSMREESPWVHIRLIISAIKLFLARTYSSKAWHLY